MNAAWVQLDKQSLNWHQLTTFSASKYLHIQCLQCAAMLKSIFFFLNKLYHERTYMYYKVSGDMNFHKCMYTTGGVFLPIIIRPALHDTRIYKSLCKPTENVVSLTQDSHLSNKVYSWNLLKLIFEILTST